MLAGMLPPRDMAAGTCCLGVWSQMYIPQNFWFNHLFFQKSK
jgi:hypothetical protein